MTKLSEYGDAAPQWPLRIMSNILRSRQQIKFDKFHKLLSARHGPLVLDRVLGRHNFRCVRDEQIVKQFFT